MQSAGLEELVIFIFFSGGWADSGFLVEVGFFEGVFDLDTDFGNCVFESILLDFDESVLESFLFDFDNSVLESFFAGFVESVSKTM